MGTPTTRGTDSTSGNSNTRDIAYPAGTVAGDTAYVFFGGAYGCDVPAGWDLVFDATTSGWFGGIFRRVLDAGDIATGYTTFASPAGSGVWTYAIWTGVGEVFHRLPVTYGYTGSSTAFNLDSHLATRDDDLVLCYDNDKTWDDCTITGGTVLEFNANATGASCALHAITATADGLVTFNIDHTWGAAAWQGAIALTDTAPAATGHRYWRIRNIANQSSQTGIGDIEMAQTAGGPDLCVGGTAFASGSYGGGYAASSAFDGSTSSNWFQGGGGTYQGSYIGYDFGAGVEFDIVEVRTGPGSEDNNGMPRIFDIEYSDDDATWTWAWTCYNTTWSASTKVTFTKPTEQAANRWWGIFCIDNNIVNREIVLSEIEWRETIGGADETGSGTPTYYPKDGGYADGNAYDNNTATLCFNGSSDRGTVFRYDFGSDISAVECVITASNGTGGNNGRAPRNGYFMYSQDGLAWSRCGTFAGEVYAALEQKEFELDAPGGGGPDPDPVRRRNMTVVN